MRLYHGTSERHWESIREKGIVPRKRQRGNWQHTVTSNPSAVYLTDAYAAYFAMAASKDDEYWLLLEIETDLLPEDGFAPDEDCLEQANRAQTAHLGDMKARTKFWRGQVKRLRHLWRDSLKGLGTCQYTGTIPPEAITRAVSYDPRSNGVITWRVADPTITIINYQILGAKYRGLTRWFFEDDVQPKDIEYGWAALPEKFRGELRDAITKRDGLTRLK